MVGLGAVGGLVAGALQKAGHHVSALTSPDHRHALADRGYTVYSPRFGDFRVNPIVLERLEIPCDTIFICVKAYRLERALRAIDAGRIGDATVVPLLNGLEHMAVLRGLFEPSRVLAGSIGRIETKRAAFDVVIHSNPDARVWLAGLPEAAGRVEAVASLLRSARFDVDIVADESTLLWGKLVRLAPLACLTAASGLTLGEVRSAEPWRSALEEAVAETVAAARAHGVELSVDAMLELIAGLPGHISTSMARDIEAGRPSELDAIAGAVRRAAADVGLTCPTLEAMAERAAGVRATS